MVLQLTCVVVAPAICCGLRIYTKSRDNEASTWPQLNPNKLLVMDLNVFLFNAHVLHSPDIRGSPLTTDEAAKHALQHPLPASAEINLLDRLSHLP